MGPIDVAAQNSIDLNSASVEQLGALEGIGPRLAERIVAYRAAAGPFASLDHLMRVPGIDRWTLERLRSRLVARPPEANPDADASWSQGLGLPLFDSDPNSLSAEDEEALDAELYSYGEMEVTLDEQAEEPFYSDQAVLSQETVLKAEPRPVNREASPVAQPAAPPLRAAQQAGPWRGGALVFLGVLLGLMVAMVGLVLFAGTQDLASRRMVLGLSRNLATMQTNQEMTWERLDQVAASATALEQRMADLEGLANRLVSLEEQAAVHSSQLAAQEAALAKVQQSLAALQEETLALHTGQEGQIGGAQTQVGALSETVEGLQQLVADLRDRIAGQEVSLRILRALLRQLGGEPAAP